jgi:hypothetical protein
MAQGQCYARIYDEAHLLSHPQQKLRQFSLALSRKPDYPPNSSNKFEAAIAFKVRNSRDEFQPYGYCAADESGATCTLESDNGSLAFKADGAEGLIVTIERLESEGRFSFSGNLADSDDKTVKLRLAPASKCRQKA